MNRTVYLVNAGNDPGISGIANDASFPALAPLALGTWLRTRIPDIAVVARDGQLHASRTNSVPKRIAEDIDTHKPAIVGISSLCTSYQQTLAIAEYAHTQGAKVVIGNDQARDLSRAIITHRPHVDYVVAHEYGERPLEMLVRHLLDGEGTLDAIPSLTYRDANGNATGFDFTQAADRELLSITSNAGGYGLRRVNGLDLFPTVDRNLYPREDWEQFKENYLKKFSKLHKEPVTGVTTMNRARGCSRALDPCAYCDLKLDIATSSAERFWEEVTTAHEQVQANVFYEVCDSLATFPTLVRAIAQQKPQLSFEPQFFVYAQAIDLVKNPRIIDDLKAIGVFRLNIGLDAMSNPTLRYMKGTARGDSVENNRAALALAKDAGIAVYSSFVLGSAAETPHTLRETIDTVKELIDKGFLSDVEAQPLLPLPGNREGKQLEERGLMQHALNKKQAPDWPVHVDTLSELYVNNCSGVSYEQVIAGANEIRHHARDAGINFGSGVSGESNYE